MNAGEGVLVIVAVVLALLAGGVGGYALRWRGEPARDAERATQRVSMTFTQPWAGFDLDAVRASGDRAVIAVRAAQTARGPRAARGRHLAVVA